MKYFGAHVSAAGGIEKVFKRSEDIGADALALFTVNQRQWNPKDLSEESAELFKKEMQKSGISNKYILPHNSYLINLGNPDKAKRERSEALFMADVRRVMRLGLKMINFHMGSHLGKLDEKSCIGLISESLNMMIENSDNVVFVIENCAGQGSTVGYSFEQIMELIEMTDDKSRVGICLDTCHMFAAGYDIRSECTFYKTFQEFECMGGFDYLKGMHLNDSRTELGSGKDRHQSLGKGEIGWEAFRLIAEDNRFDGIPLILETIRPEIWKEEIRVLRSFENR